MACTLLFVGAVVAASDLSRGLHFDITPQSLSEALIQFSKQTGLQFTAPGAAIDGINTRGVRGRYSADAALKALLQDTGFTFTFVDEGTVAISKLTSAAAELSPRTGVALSATMEGQPGGKNESGPERRTELEEVVVTAQMRPEPVQKVPIAITALSASDLDKGRFFNLRDLSDAVPNFSAEAVFGSSSTASFFIRGHGEPGDTFSFDTPVAVYVDGVYLARNKGALIDLVDVDRIEVLRGPQGTLFGRNASAGAIRVFSKNAPLDAPDLDAEVATGTNDLVDVRLTYGAPIIKDELGIRVSLLSKDQDGYMLNLSDGRRAQAADIAQAKLALRWAPQDNVELTLRGDKLRDRSDARVGSDFVNNPDNDFYTFESNLTNRHQVDTSGISLTADWSTKSFKLTAITAYRDLWFHQSDTDADGSTARRFEVDLERLDEWQFTQEVYLVGEHVGEVPLRWTAGVFYLYEFNDFIFDVNFLEDENGNGTAGLFEQDSHAFAPYIQATYPITDKFDVTGGVRWTYEKKDFIAHERLEDDVTINPDFNFHDIFEDRVWTWRASADYALTDDILLYAYAATGYRSGAVGAIGTTAEEILAGRAASEEVLSYEAGIKSDWFSRTLRANLNYYYSDYASLQTECDLPDEGGFAGEARDANMRTHGFEAQIVWLPLNGLELTVNYGDLHQIIRNLDPECARGTTESVSYDYEWNVAAVYIKALPNNAGTVRFGIDYSGHDERSSDLEQDTALALPQLALMDAHIAYITPDERWQFTLSGFNLKNEIYPAAVINVPGIATTYFPGEPRHWSFSVRYRL